MSEVRLVIRDAEHDLHATRHGSFAECVVAALSAEPATIHDLEQAIERFHAPSEHRFFAGFSRGIVDEPYDAGVVIVDLAARLVVCDSTYFSAGREGWLAYHDGRSATEFRVRYHLSEDWKFERDAIDWRPTADNRRQQRAAQPRLDVRAVLYGKPLLEFIAGECHAAFGDGCPTMDLDADVHAESLIRSIHAKWLTTPRSDLRGDAPRATMLADRDFLSWDLQDRSEQWSMMQRCPRGLDRESMAYRYAGFGTHELVTYYEMVRGLLWACRDEVESLRESNNSSFMDGGDFLTREVPRLEQMRDQWLEEPDPEFSGRTPRSIIHNERSRIPEGMSGHEAIVDCDCPMCLMQAELPGPMFWHIDGCNMDDEFAFSFHRTIEDWDQEQREYEEFNRRFEAKQEAQRQLGVEYPGGGYADPESVWERSFAAPQAPGESPLMRLFSIGANLAELIVDLRGSAENRELIDLLQRDFGNLREVAGATEADAAHALIEPVLERFCESLEQVTNARPDLQRKCLDLHQRLQRFLEPPEVAKDATESFDDDLPF